jgi:hypothetical protein
MMPSAEAHQSEESSANDISSLSLAELLSALLKSLKVRSGDSLTIKTLRSMIANDAATVRHIAVFPCPVSS